MEGWGFKWWPNFMVMAKRAHGRVRCAQDMDRLLAGAAREMGAELARRYVLDTRLASSEGMPCFGYRQRHKGPRLEEWLQEQLRQQGVRR